MADNCNIVSDIIALLHVLAEHNYTGKCRKGTLEYCFDCLLIVQLVRRSVVSAVMVSLSEAHRSSWSTDVLLILHLSLLNKLSTSGQLCNNLLWHSESYLSL